MKRYYGIMSSAFFAFVLVGCQVDPFPANTPLAVDKPNTRPIDKPWGIEVSERMEFYEGSRNDYAVKAHVPPPATPRIAVVDLPVGATFDSVTGTLSWLPDYAAGNDPRDPTAESRTYPVRVLLSSSSEPQSVMEKQVSLVVYNVSRSVDLKWNVSQFQMTEGKPFAADVEIKSADYPQGPFQFLITGLPSGVEIQPVVSSPTLFRVRYTPSLDVVGRNDDYSNGIFSRVWKAEAIVVDPSGHKTLTTFNWRVVDARQDAVISAPSSVQQLDDIRLQVVSMDPNFEESPKVSVAPVKFGTLDLQEEKEGFTTRTAIRWSGIPENQIGTTSSLDIRACVYSSSSQKNRCYNKSILVKIEARPLQEPTIDRTRWPLGQVRYLRSKSSSRVRLPIQNPNSTGNQFSVTIEPASIRSEVEYRNGELILQPRNPGFKQFNVNVKTPQGLSRSESFSFECLPESWSSVLVLGDGLRDPEIAATLALFPGAQVMNPLMQEMNDRALALREVVVLGTSLMMDSAAVIAAMPAIEQIQTVVFQSPRMDQLGNSLWSWFGSLGAKVQGRVSVLLGANFPGLQQLPILPDAKSGLTKPVKQVLLSGGLTSESRDPLIFATPSQSCKPVLSMQYSPAASLPPYELPVVVKCEERGKRWILSGLEWADLQPQASFDQGIVVRWIQEVLK